MSLLENIQSLCKEYKTSLPNLEKELGFGKGAMYKWDTNSPSIDKIEKVANYFKVSLDRILYGFEYTEFVNLVNYVKDDRTIERFSRDTSVDLNELYKICLGFKFERPSEEVVMKIASSNPVDFLVSTDDLLEAAGYISQRQGEAERRKIIEDLVDQFEDAGFEIRFENDHYYEKVSVDHPDRGTVESMFLEEFINQGEGILNRLVEEYKNGETEERGDKDWAADAMADPEINVFFKDFANAPKERREETIDFFRFIREKEKNRKPGDKQGE